MIPSQSLPMPPRERPHCQQLHRNPELPNLQAMPGLARPWHGRLAAEAGMLRTSFPCRQFRSSGHSLQPPCWHELLLGCCAIRPPGIPSAGSPSAEGRLPPATDPRVLPSAGTTPRLPGQAPAPHRLSTLGRGLPRQPAPLARVQQHLPWSTSLEPSKRPQAGQQRCFWQPVGRPSTRGAQQVAPQRQGREEPAKAKPKTELGVDKTVHRNASEVDG